jgi:hypothetical protein
VRVAKRAAAGRGAQGLIFGGYLSASIFSLNSYSASSIFRSLHEPEVGLVDATPKARLFAADPVGHKFHLMVKAIEAVATPVQLEKQQQLQEP